jgi:hypothetical protein
VAGTADCSGEWPVGALIIMGTQGSALAIAVRPAASETERVQAVSSPRDGLEALVFRFGGEFREMPGLRLSPPQAARLFGVQAEIALAVLDELRRTSVLARANDGRYALNVEGAEAGHFSQRVDQMSADTAIQRLAPGSLKDASPDRLTCLMRHWTWAEEAKDRLERELADGWEYDDAPFADRPFGSYYHWCALLCGFGEAVMEGGFLSPSQMDPIRADLEASLPALRACRQLLVVIPSRLEEQPRIVDLVRSEDTLGRLRRLHVAFGEALRQEQMAREVESLDQ